jgi:hypothetical protein
MSLGFVLWGSLLGCALQKCGLHKKSFSVRENLFVSITMRKSLQIDFVGQKVLEDVQKEVFRS